MTYALHRDLISFNPTANIEKEFDSLTVEHFKILKPEDLSKFMFTLQNVQIHLQTHYLSLWQQLSIMTRSNEVDTAKWADIVE